MDADAIDFNETQVTVVLNDGNHFADLIFDKQKNGKISIRAYMHTGSVESNKLIMVFNERDPADINMAEIYDILQKSISKYTTMMTAVKDIHTKKSKSK